MNERPAKSAAGDKPQRLTPKPDVLRELYLRSGNVCAFPGCQIVMINNDGVMIGEICHIEGALPEGSRFNLNMTNEQRRALSNLVLFCGNHHTLVDGNPDEYTVGRLKEIKAEHENKFSAISNTLEKKFADQFVDNTDKIIKTAPRTLKRARDTLKFQVEKAKFRKGIKELDKYADQLRKVPEDLRKFMLALLHRAKKLGWSNGPSVSVDVYDVVRAFNLADYKVKEIASSLERYNVGSIYERGEDDHGQDRYDLVLYDPWDYLTWSDIDEFCKRQGIDIERFVMDVQFNLLD